jgi:hypothetical protein
MQLLRLLALLLKLFNPPQLTSPGTKKGEHKAHHIIIFNTKCSFNYAPAVVLLARLNAKGAKRLAAAFLM